MRYPKTAHGKKSHMISNDFCQFGAEMISAEISSFLSFSLVPMVTITGFLF